MTDSPAARRRGRASFRRQWYLPVLAAALTFGLSASAARAEVTDEEAAAVDAAVARALDYLARTQQTTGAWRTDQYGECTAATSLAVMAFMAAGHLPGEGPYGAQIERGIRWVLQHQEDNGMLVHKRSHGPMYSHGISTMMLAEAAGMVSEADAAPLRRALERAVKLILEAQAVSKDRRHAGGWRYQVDSRDSDLSVTAWQVLALRAAKDIGCDVPAEAIDAAIDYVKNCSVRDNRGFGYQPGSGQTETLSGTGITALEVCGVHHAPESVGAADWLLEHPLEYHSNYYYYGVYYTAVGMFKMGGEYAERNYRRLLHLLLRSQRQDGSWEAESGSERGIGNTYSTSMSVLALTIEYRYLPIYQR